MKLADINENLVEKVGGPAGFAARAKAKLQKQTPFAKQKRRQAAAKDVLFKQAKEIKDDLMAWKAEAFAGGKGAKQELTMDQFLEWMGKKGYGEVAMAAAKEVHPNLFKGKEAEPKKQDVKADGEQDVKADGEPKVKADGEQSEEEIRAAYAKRGEELEAEREARGDTTEDAGEEKEPKVDTSASIYEARLRALLEADDESVDMSLASSADGKVSDDPLNDNQIDTLIVRALEKKAQLKGGADVPTEKEPTRKEKRAAAKAEKPKEKEKDQAAISEPPSEADSDTFAIRNTWKGPLDSMLQKIVKGGEFDNKDKKYASRISKELG